MWTDAKNSEGKRNRLTILFGTVRPISFVLNKFVVLNEFCIACRWQMMNFYNSNMLKFTINEDMRVKITEIGIDDSQTGYYWLQIFVKNQKEAFSLRKQIFQDQEIRERLYEEIKQSQTTVNNSSIELEIILHNMIIKKLQSVIGDKNGHT